MKNCCSTRMKSEDFALRNPIDQKQNQPKTCYLNRSTCPPNGNGGGVFCFFGRSLRDLSREADRSAFFAPCPSSRNAASFEFRSTGRGGCHLCTSLFCYTRTVNQVHLFVATQPIMQTSIMRYSRHARCSQSDQSTVSGTGNA